MLAVGEAIPPHFLRPQGHDPEHLNAASRLARPGIPALPSTGEFQKCLNGELCSSSLKEQDSYLASSFLLSLSFPPLFSFARLSLFCECHEKFRSKKTPLGGRGEKADLSAETELRSLQPARCRLPPSPWLPLPCLCFPSLIIGNDLPPSKRPTPPLPHPPAKAALGDLLTYFLQ